MLVGVAVAHADTYPRWLGWVACSAGIGSILAGLLQALTGKPTVASLILTIIGPTVIALWMLVIGALLRRRSATAHVHRHRVATAASTAASPAGRGRA